MYRAYDAEAERPVAVKLFTLDLPPERVHQLGAELERLIAANLRHPAIAAPIASGIHGVWAYLATDFVTAESLDLAVREYGPAPPADAVRVAAQLAGALDVAHAAGVTHGALHPRDILLSTDDTRITGLGVARALESVGVTPPIRRPYTAPERIADEVWDRRIADIFGLGALMFELLWGRRVTGFGAQAVGDLAEIPGTDMEALRAVFARALAEKPLQRFQTARALADALKSAFIDLDAATPSVRLKADATTEKEPRLPLDDSEPLPAIAEPIAPAQAVAVEPASAHALEPPAEAPTVRVRPPRPHRRPRAIEPVGELDALRLRDAEERRYEDVEIAPAIVPPGARPSTGSGRAVGTDPLMVSPELAEGSNHEPELEPIGPPPGLLTDRGGEPMSAVARSRSAWPLVVSLMLGLGIGFAGGYGFGMRDRPAPAIVDAPEAAASPSAAPTAGATPPAPAGREFTEGTVPDAPKATSNTPSIKQDTTPERKTDAAAKGPGRLLVRSTPTGARVFVDDREYGPTPVAVRNLTRGAHRVRVARDGYATEERRVTITAARPAQAMTVALAPPKTAPPAAAAGFNGVLTVESRPAGAKVFVDGRLVGTTPLQLPEIKAGEHAIRLEREGYRRWSSSVRVVASERQRVTASLER